MVKKALLSRVASGGSSRSLYNIEETTDDTVAVQLGSGLQSLAASVKEDFSRLNSNGGLDLAAADQVKLITWIYLELLAFPAQKEELRFSPIIFASPQLGKKVQAG